MEMLGEYFIYAPREAVWTAINDPDILKQAIPGCDDLEKHSETEFSATVVAKIGPVKAKFKGEVTLSNLNPPESYTIAGEGSGGVVGFAKGGADIYLTQADGGTRLTYKVNARVGGKLAQIGSRLVDAAARKMADQFFGALAALIAPADEEENSASELASDETTSVNENANSDITMAAQAAPGTENDKSRIWIYIAIVAAVVIIAWAFNSFG